MSGIKKEPGREPGLIYTINNKDKITQLKPSTVLSSMGMGSAMTSMSPMSTAIFNEMLDDRETLETQYDVLAGRWPKEYNEVILVLSEPNAMPDMLVYGLGLRDENELIDMMAKLMAGEKVEETSEALAFTYDDLMNLPLKLMDATATYKYNAEYNIYEDMTGDKAFMQKVYDDAEDLKIVGIVCANENSTSSVLTPGIAYTKELTHYVIEKASESEIVKKQKTNREVDVFSGKRFDDKSQEAGLDFQDMISIDSEMLTSAFGMEVSEKDIASMTEGYMAEISSSITTDTKGAEEAFSETLVTFTTDMLNGYIDENLIPVANFATMKLSQVENVVQEFMNLESTQEALATLESNYVIPKATFQTMYTELLQALLKACFSVIPGTGQMTDEPILMLNDQMVEMLLAEVLKNKLVFSFKIFICNKKVEELQKKSSELKNASENLNNQIELLNKRQGEVEKKYAESVKKLEDIASMTAEKNALFYYEKYMILDENCPERLPGFLIDKKQ